jgi:eukaryotic-like serine/threonine-protein kinase
MQWGTIVVKISEQLNARQIAYLQKEIHLLNSFSCPYYPKLHYSEAFSRHPETDDPLLHRLFVSIEERIDAIPLHKCQPQFSTEAKVSLLLLNLVDGLDLLWSRQEKIVHRDLKPANILIRKDESVVIIDLGIVREEGSAGLTDDYALWGPCTPPYASPEHANNDKKNISFKSDFFALGTIAYELISGSNPYHDSQSDTATDILLKIRTFVPKTLHALGLSSRAFSDIIEVLMKKEPFERFRTVSRFKQALLDFREASYGG